ncbi:MAG: hypothetical protein GY862_17740, partial [Gammaproteobacteria bacterium]|nr:hypothetical protein [Gammaproteobacteria bacterium]
MTVIVSKGAIESAGTTSLYEAITNCVLEIHVTNTTDTELTVNLEIGGQWFDANLILPAIGQNANSYSSGKMIIASGEFIKLITTTS